MSPCFVVGASTNYNSDVIKCYQNSNAPLSIKTSVENIHHVIKIATENNIRTENIILIIDVEYLLTPNLDNCTLNINHFIAINVNRFKWKSLVLLSGSAPKDHSALALGRNCIPRLDWRLWNSVRQTYPNIDYGDYANLHSDLTPPPPVAMRNATVSVRYTTDSEWIIYKGVNPGGANGQSMTLQYIQHAQQLICEPKFEILTKSWADKEISKVAAMPLSSISGAGGRTEWAGYSINRHLSLVAAQLP